MEISAFNRFGASGKNTDFVIKTGPCVDGNLLGTLARGFLEHAETKGYHPGSPYAEAVAACEAILRLLDA